MKFKIDQQLKHDTLPIIALELCNVSLLNDNRFPWLILIPKRARISEIHQLKTKDQFLLMKEIVVCSKIMEKKFSPEKINVGALGNIVSQLHIHVIGRFKSDDAWPGSAWGSGKPVHYSTKDQNSLTTLLTQEFNSRFNR